jgi:hypothetical protein
MRYFLIIAAYIITLNATLAQLENSVWYFGEYAGIKFRDDIPIMLHDGQLNSSENSSSFSDYSGNLIIYTDGVSVYNQFHSTILNGKNLWGHNSTTQTLIVPKPGDEYEFFVFTMSPQYDQVVENDSVGCHYSLVNINHGNGLGEIIEKNTLLFKKTTEKVSAVHHANGTNIWVMFHEWESNCFRAYLISENGIEMPPVISCAGMVHQGGGPVPGLNHKYNAAGQMKISPDGSLLALALTASRTIEVFFLITAQDG